MNDFVSMCALLCTLVVGVLLIFSLFAIGFLIGYFCEDKRLSKRSKEKIDFEESEEDKKMKREWKNFLSYDGSITKE